MYEESGDKGGVEFVVGNQAIMRKFPMGIRPQIRETFSIIFYF